MKPILNSIPKQPQSWLIVLGILGVAAYCLPWLTNPGAGLSFGAYDLAEWASLHPTVRTSSPTLLTSLLLRLPLACSGLVIAITVWKKNPTKYILLVLLIGIALSPPLEFFTQYRDDPNYQQQFALAIITVILGMVNIIIRAGRWRSIVGVTIALIGGVSGLIGLIQGYDLMRGFELPTQVGVGGVVFIIISIGIGILMVLLRPEVGLKQTR